jgi:hypothetical protein
MVLISWNDRWAGDCALPDATRVVDAGVDSGGSQAGKSVSKLRGVGEARRGLRLISR